LKQICIKRYINKDDDNSTTHLIYVGALKGTVHLKKHLSFKSNKLWGYSVVKYFFTGLAHSKKKKKKIRETISTFNSSHS